MGRNHYRSQFRVDLLESIIIQINIWLLIDAIYWQFYFKMICTTDYTRDW